MNNSPPFPTSVGVGNGVSVEEDYAPEKVASIHPNTGGQVIGDVDDDYADQPMAIKAYVVDSDAESTASEIEALNVDVLPTRNEKAKIARNKLRQYTLLSVAFIIVLAVVIMVPLYFTVLKADPLDTSEAPSPVPSVSPSQAPTSELFAEYADKVSTISNPVMLMTPGTAQYKAIRWLFHNDPAGRRDLDDDRLLQRYIAAVFYYSTSKGRGWYDCYPGDVSCTSNSKKEWFSAWDECEWYGFSECNEDKLVTRFVIINNENGAGASIHGNGLHGTIPSEFGYLTNLNILSIAKNPLLTGPIPSTFGKLTNLRKFSLLFNNIEGPWIDGLLDNMTGLTNLFLNYNDFNITLPPDISRRTGLQKLGLAGNNIYGTIPSEYGRLYELSMLELSDNVITGTIPRELYPSNITSGLPALKHFDVENNRITGTLATEIGNMKLIEKLYLSNNKFVGEIPASISSIGMDNTKRKSLWLDRNNFIGSIPAEIGDISLLYHLNLTNNNLTGSVPEKLCSLPNADMRVFSVDCGKVSCLCCSPLCAEESQ